MMHGNAMVEWGSEVVGAICAEHFVFAVIAAVAHFAIAAVGVTVLLGTAGILRRHCHPVHDESDCTVTMNVPCNEASSVCFGGQHLHAMESFACTLCTSSSYGHDFKTKCRAFLHCDTDWWQRVIVYRAQHLHFAVYIQVEHWATSIIFGLFFAVPFGFSRFICVHCQWLVAH